MFQGSRPTTCRVGWPVWLREVGVPWQQARQTAGKAAAQATAQHRAAQHSTPQHRQPHLIRYLRIVPRWRMPTTASACGQGKRSITFPASQACKLVQQRNIMRPLQPQRQAPTEPSWLHPCVRHQQEARSSQSPAKRHSLAPARTPASIQLTKPCGTAQPRTCAYSSPLSKSSATSWLTYLASTQIGCSGRRKRGLALQMCIGDSCAPGLRTVGVHPDRLQNKLVDFSNGRRKRGLAVEMCIGDRRPL